jgi:hypothetical protein
LLQAGLHTRGPSCCMHAEKACWFVGEVLVNILQVMGIFHVYICPDCQIINNDYTKTKLKESKGSKNQRAQYAFFFSLFIINNTYLSFEKTYLRKAWKMTSSNLRAISNLVYFMKIIFSWNLLWHTKLRCQCQI